MILMVLTVVYLPTSRSIRNQSLSLAELIKLNEDLHEVDEKSFWAEVFNSEVSYNDFKLFYIVK